MSTATQSGRTHAATVLDVAAGAPPEAVRAAFLRRLAAENFVPPEECVAAANALANAALPLSPDAVAEAAAIQRAEVEAFAAAYWSREPAARQSEWQELVVRTTDSYARFRLEQLEGGLALSPVPQVNPLAEEIAAAVRELYVLGPRERVVRRLTWLAENGERIDDLRDAGRRIRDDDPELAKLEPELLSQLAKGIAFTPVHSVDSETIEAERNERIAKAEKTLVGRTKLVIDFAYKGEGKGSSDFKLVIFGLIFFFGVVRVVVQILQAGSDDHTPRRLPPPTLRETRSPEEWRNLQRGQDSEAKPEFSKIEVQLFVVYEINERQKNFAMEKPQRYDAWVAQGRPALRGESMSSPELPDDPRHWPDDPFELLGVARGSGEIDIKRAYTRLIRRFKPEHRPDEFRRIREAYEACLNQFQWFFPAAFVEAAPAPQEPAPAPVEPTIPATPEFGEFHRPPPRIDEAERLWSLAVNGKTEEAYAGLLFQAETHPDRPDLPLRLYWLLALYPALDAERTRHDWLAGALVRSRLSGPAVELYRRELGFDGKAALSGPYLQLLETESHPNDMLSVARMRLAAAGRSHSWKHAGGDLKVLARALPLHNESAWLGFLVAAANWTAFDHPWPLAAHIRDELNKLRHLELAHSDSFDRIEETERLAKDWGEMPYGPKNWEEDPHGLLTPTWARLVPIAWVEYGDFAEAELKWGIRDVVENQSESLHRFDRLQRKLGTKLIELLIRGMERFRYSRCGEDIAFPSELIRALAAKLPDAYQPHRETLLDFLRIHELQPAEFVEACQSHPDMRVREIAQQVRDDLSLRLVCLSCSLEWVRRNPDE